MQLHGDSKDGWRAEQQRRLSVLRHAAACVVHMREALVEHVFKEGKKARWLVAMWHSVVAAAWRAAPNHRAGVDLTVGAPSALQRLAR
eukprot:scaffold154746_cov31-Tisochrysis_lutea.AAC.2